MHAIWHPYTATLSIRFIGPKYNIIYFNYLEFLLSKEFTYLFCLLKHKI
jgi:hypothetical protein